MFRGKLPFQFVTTKLSAPRRTKRLKFLNKIIVSLYLTRMKREWGMAIVLKITYTEYPREDGIKNIFIFIGTFWVRVIYNRD